MTNPTGFIETKEYKRFAEFCDACVKYKYIGLCYGAPGVGKTLSSRHYADWDMVSYQIDYSKAKNIGDNATDEIFDKHTLFYTAPADKPSKIAGEIGVLGYRLGMTKAMYKAAGDNEVLRFDNLTNFSEVNLIIVDEVDRLKLPQLEILRDIYDQHDLAIILIGMPGIEKRLSRYPQLYSRIGFAHEFSSLSKDETHHILEYKWTELGLNVTLEDFSDYEAITTIIKITNGNFRLIHRLFSQIDRILEINNLKTITSEVVEAARDSLIIGIK